MKPDSEIHFRVLKAAYDDAKVKQYLITKDDSNSIILKKITCIALKRFAIEDGGIDVYRVRFNYNTINTGLNDEEVFAIVHLNNQDKIKVVKQGIIKKNLNINQ